MRTKRIHQIVTFKATPKEVYDALINAKRHAEFTGSAAKITAKVGGTFSAYDGYNIGKILELIPNRKIVVALRHDEDDWPKDHFSTVTFELRRVKEGTRLAFTQLGLPVQHAGHINEGWKEYYWEPMKVMFDRGF